MFTTADYLKLEPWEALIEIVNNRYLLELDSARTKLLEFTPGVGTQTSIKLSTQRSGAVGNLLPSFSERTFSYDRLDLTTYFGSAPVVIAGVKPPVSTYALTQVLSAQTGIKFSPNDFINEIIETDAQLANYELEAHPRSLRWVGSVRFTGQNPKIPLGGLGVVSAPNALTYTQSDATKIEGAHYLMPYDFSEFRAELLPVRLGSSTLQPSRLTEILRQVTKQGEVWVCQDTLAPWNISVLTVQNVSMYKVLYNGPVTNRWTPRTDMRYVLVLQLDASRCANIGGHLLLHFK